MGKLDHVKQEKKNDFKLRIIYLRFKQDYINASFSLYVISNN